MIRVLIADDSAAMRDGLSSLLSQQGDFEVVGLARDGLQALEKARELRLLGISSKPFPALASFF